MCRSSGTQVLIVTTSGWGRGAGNTGSGNASQRLAPGHISGIMVLRIWLDVRSTLRCGQDATSKNRYNDSTISCTTSLALRGPAEKKPEHHGFDCCITERRFVEGSEMQKHTRIVRPLQGPPHSEKMKLRTNAFDNLFNTIEAGPSLMSLSRTVQANSHCHLSAQQDDSRDSYALIAPKGFLKCFFS